MGVVHHIDIEQGLSNGFFTTMVIDKHGAVWCGSEMGLNRIMPDGCKAFLTYNSELKANEIVDLYYHEPDDQLWIIYHRGRVSIMDCQTMEIQSHPYPDKIGDGNISCIAKAADGGIWIGNEAQGLIRHYDTKTHEYWDLDFIGVGPYGKKKRCIIDDGAGHLYIGYSNGFGIIDLEQRTYKFLPYDPDDKTSLPGPMVRAMIIDHYGNLWVGTNHGVAIYNPLTCSFLHCNKENGFDVSSHIDNIHGMHIVNENELWLASEPGGITSIDLSDFADQRPHNLKFRSMTPENSQLNSYYPRRIAQDSYGNVWIAYYGGGVDMISHISLPFGMITKSEEDGNGTRQTPLLGTWGLASDLQDNVWAGAGTMLFCCKYGKVVKSWDILPYLPRSIAKIFILECDRRGRVWIGVDDVGPIIFDPETEQFRFIHLDEEYLDVHCFCELADGTMMIGSEKGLYAYDDSMGDHAKKVSDIDRQLSIPIIFALNQDREGRLWVGTFGSGIYIFDSDNKLLRQLSYQYGFPTNEINQILPDAQGNITWVATREGLVRVSNPLGSLTNDESEQPWQCYYYHRGIPTNNMRALQQDKQGRIWISTHTQMLRWDDYRKQFTAFDYHYGLPKGGYTEKAACRTSDGTLYFASTNGICYFNPRFTDLNIKVSPIKIDNFEGENGYYTATFSVSDYSQREMVDYAYMMKGLDGQWHTTKDDDYVIFTGLPAGSYELMVKARLHGGEWDESNIARMRIDVPPSPWWSWWAKLIYSITLILIVVYFMRQYRRHLYLQSHLRHERQQRIAMQELNNERSRFYTNVTHELRTPLTLILGPLEDLVADTRLPQSLRHHVQTIRDSAQRLLDLVNKILEFRKSETRNRRLAVAREDLCKLVTEIGLNFKELNNNPEVEVIIQTPATALPTLYFDSEAITIILQNLLSNALKYTPKGTVTLSLELLTDSRQMVVSVSDTGYGIADNALPHIFEQYYQAHGAHQASGTGIGLALSYYMAKLHHTDLRCESKEGKGSTFSFVLNIDETYPEALHKDETMVKTEDPALIQQTHAESKEEETAGLPVLLIVEDNADIRQYVIDSFADDYEVLDAPDGKRGLDIAQTRIPDIIVSDIMMPVMDGIEMCRQLKSDIQTSHIPVVLLTAKETLEDKEKGYDVGADSYLTKPFSAKLLRSRLNNILATRRLLAKRLTAVQGNAAPQPVATDVPELSKLDSRFIEKLDKIIADNIASGNLNIAFLTDQLGMSSSSLYRKVKGLTSLSPNEYIRNSRLRFARELLLDGKHNVTETAYLAGFGTPNYFRDCFRAEYGLSPTDFVNQNKS